MSAHMVPQAAPELVVAEIEAMIGRITQSQAAAANYERAALDHGAKRPRRTGAF